MRQYHVLAAILACVAPSAHAAEPASDYKMQARELFRQVIAFKTQVGEAQVPVMANFLADRFRAAGFPPEDVHVVLVGETAALVVRYRGKPGGPKPILAMAHMDVVTAKPSDWKRDPFTLIEEGGYFFGRGTEDIKSGVEETSQQSTIDLAQHHRDLIDAQFALNSDAGGGTLDEKDGHPIVYGLQTAEKTYATYELTIRNPGGHSSEPRADNAIYELADALKKLQGYRFPVMWTPATREYFRVTGQHMTGELGEAMRAFALHPMDAKADATLNASPAYVGMTRTTCIPTLLSAGHADNALPQSATASVNCRIFPGVSAEKVQATLQQLVGSQVEIRLPFPVIESPPSQLSPDIVDKVTRTVHAIYPEVPVVPRQDSGATDGAVFRGVGIPTYGTNQLFMKDSDEFAHGLNERIPVNGFYDGLQFWYLLIRNFTQ
jgi:acetylornithine deacetylase/succinyl-diaminopimelate desuccinylase-like protein